MRSSSISPTAPSCAKGRTRGKINPISSSACASRNSGTRLTPLGAMAKPEIREIARTLGLKVADKVDSQEICFVPGNDYKAFLRSHLGETEFHAGGIYDLEGNFLAEHAGIEMFTIGQRKGLPGGSAQPRYVVDIDPLTNRILVGGAEDLISEEFEIDRVNWVSREMPSEPIEVTVKIRYSHPGTRATLYPLAGRLRAGGAARTAKGGHARTGRRLL